MISMYQLGQCQVWLVISSELGIISNINNIYFTGAIHIVLILLIGSCHWEKFNSPYHTWPTARSWQPARRAAPTVARCTKRRVPVDKTGIVLLIRICIIFFNGPYDGSFLFLYFCPFNTVDSIWEHKDCQWLDSNRGPVVSEATYLPTVSQLLPLCLFFSWKKKVVRADELNRYSNLGSY